MPPHSADAERVAQHSPEGAISPRFDRRLIRPQILFAWAVTSIFGGQLLARHVAEMPYVSENSKWIGHFLRAALSIVGVRNPSPDSLATASLLAILVACTSAVALLLALGSLLWLWRRERPIPLPHSQRHSKDGILDSEKWRSRVIAEGLTICPSCECDEVTMGACKIGSKTVHQEYTCEACQHRFCGFFTLTGCYRGHPE